MNVNYPISTFIKSIDRSIDLYVNVSVPIYTATINNTIVLDILHNDVIYLDTIIPIDASFSNPVMLEDCISSHEMYDDYKYVLKKNLMRAGVPCGHDDYLGDFIREVMLVAVWEWRTRDIRVSV